MKMLQKGFTIVSAIFVVVILALVGTFMVSISSLTRSSESLGLLGLKAFFAAKSGIEWGVYKVTEGSGPYSCPTSPTTISINQGGLKDMSVTVTCTSATFSERGETLNVFEISAMGERGTTSSPDYVSRRLYATVIQPDN